MKKLARLFGRSIRFAYHCFDRIVKPKFPVDDPNWPVVATQRSRYTHLYFYIIDDVLGPFSMRIGAYLPFYATYYLNGHDIIAPMLAAEGVRFRMKDNAFVSIADPDASQAAAILVIVRNRILRPIAGSLFERPPKSALKPNSTLQAQYRRTTKSFNDLIDLLKAA